MDSVVGSFLSFIHKAPLLMSSPQKTLRMTQDIYSAHFVASLHQFSDSGALLEFHHLPFFELLLWFIYIHLEDLGRDYQYNNLESIFWISSTLLSNATFNISIHIRNFDVPH
jgi:hypothetical protein